MTGAATRGLLVALLIATPALILPGVAADSTQITALMALLAGFLTFVEYNSSFPSIVEFRDAPPFNRLRFIAMFVTVLMITQVIKSHSEVTLLSGALFSLGTIIGNALDFPYSPVRLAVLMLPETASIQLVETIRAAAGLAYLVAAIALIVFVVIVRVLGWPTRHGAFNVWVNLPLFDPTAGGDVISRLQREARINIALGFLLPFLIPAMVKLASYLIDPIPFENPQTLIWTVSAWAFLPASMVMRGIAMNRVAGMIEDKRRRTYADAETEAGLQIA
ncbi:hypothetical protein JQV27_08680 [Sulfitobacter mediterraneus]|jgi:hypothetical protein|uniref:hypothetical protein n=1 Tax=Sulfitobacter TaxID=60136 RepID=UPI0019336431|nr:MULTISPECIES: hypothetical protein [Sulfitobacter]MBM1633168.1 hypothetical protein [Sulfitobacter mediterraneus]MBM1640698.1 hypothetical protein [Sulfitobacter mediterraneus]MBM1645033.1 hypothetical protein [Sulfitobacter mediterraneus]MBM1648818.1 hypothetical protein [Sulfitobacter mediterraneus]MBM1652839.1 hypothetical protein [Sulfitobacter mediterraneus]